MRVQNAQLWVHDQGEALDFYVGKLGWDVRSDLTLPELGAFRWLTVSPPSQPDFAVVLMAIPGPPVMDSETADQVRSLMAKGFAGTVFLVTEDVDGVQAPLRRRSGVHNGADRHALRPRLWAARPVRQPVAAGSARAAVFLVVAL
jgi:hypothetical protein